jgi:hypothetical protein
VLDRATLHSLGLFGRTETPPEYNAIFGNQRLDNIAHLRHKTRSRDRVPKSD